MTNGFIRQRDIKQKQREIDDTKFEISRLEKYCPNTDDDIEEIDRLKCILVSDMQELKRMKRDHQSFEALFA